MRIYRPSFALNTRLPKVQKNNLYIPNDDEIKKLMNFVYNTDMEIPILLAAFGPMRRGEICALHTDDINKNTVHVCRNMVRKDEHKVEWVIKSPKTPGSDRFIVYPDFVAEKWKDIHRMITNLNPNNITDRFSDIVSSAGIEHFRFHDLRHYCASVQHALGIPDAYIMLRGGWKSDGTLKNIYRHALSDREKAMNDKANSFFDELCNTKCNTKK